MRFFVKRAAPAQAFKPSWHLQRLLLATKRWSAQYDGVPFDVGYVGWSVAEVQAARKRKPGKIRLRPRRRWLLTALRS